jgi:hypothetical protein
MELKGGSRMNEKEKNLPEETPETGNSRRGTGFRG